MFRNLNDRIRKDERGTVGILFALAAVPAFVLIGGITDFSYVQNEKAKLQAAIDAGTLAAMHNNNLTAATARKTILNYLKSNFKDNGRIKLDYDSLKVTVTEPGRGQIKVRATIRAKVSTAFLGLIGIHEQQFSVMAEAKNGSAGLEVVMVLDNTGSMRGSKIRELRRAAKKLVKVLKDMSANSGASTVKVGLVPFTSYVTVGRNMWDAYWLDNKNCNCSKKKWDGVVGYRKPDYDIKDQEYASVKVPAIQNYYVYKWWKWYYTYKTTPPKTIVPLQELDNNGVNKLNIEIDGMKAGGWTYIPAGLVWGWRVLSKNAPYTQGVDYTTANTKNIKKVIVLMTDGANTCKRFDGKVKKGRGYMQCGTSSTEADKTMLRLCKNIKDRNIGIVTVAFDVRSSRIKKLLAECANLGSYEPSSGELEKVFGNIARKISRLYLSR